MTFPKRMKVGLVREFNNVDKPVTLDIRDETLDYNNNQTYCEIRAFMDGALIGYLSYVIYDNTIHIQIVEVMPEYKRKGVAKRMYQALQETAKENDYKIKKGYTTEEGEKFVNSLNEENNRADYVEVTLFHWRNANSLKKVFPNAKFLYFETESYYYPSFLISKKEWEENKNKLPKSCSIIEVQEKDETLNETIDSSYRVTTILNFLKQKANQILGPSWKVELVDNLPINYQGQDRNGTTDYNTKTIDIAYQNGNLSGIVETLLHEIAHALTPNHEHDKNWKSVYDKLMQKFESLYVRGLKAVLGVNG